MLRACVGAHLLAPRETRAGVLRQTVADAFVQIRGSVGIADECIRSGVGSRERRGVRIAAQSQEQRQCDDFPHGEEYCTASATGRATGTNNLRGVGVRCMPHREGHA